MTDQPESFDCMDCGITVFRFGPETHANDHHLCAECTWLRAIDDPVAREKLRQALRGRYE